MLVMHSVVVANASSNTLFCRNVASPDVGARGVLSRYRGTRDCNLIAVLRLPGSDGFHGPDSGIRVDVDRRQQTLRRIAARY